MREITKATNNFSKKMAINSRNGLPLQDNTGSHKVLGAAVMHDVDDETGEIKDVGAIITDDGYCLTTISPTIIDVLDDLIDIVDDEGIVPVRIDTRQSKSGRDFLTMTIL